MLQTDRKGKWFEIIIPKNWEGFTIDDIFRKIWEASKKEIYAFRVENRVLINGKQPNWSAGVVTGDKLLLNLFEEQKTEIPPTFLEKEIPILFEDDHLIVFNKPPFISTHPNNIETEKETLLNAGIFYLQSKGEIRNIRHIHRLDQDTSGAILFSKHSLAGSVLDHMLEERKIKRTYLAIVHGRLHSKKGTIREPIGRDRHHATRRRVSPTGQTAVTHYQVVRYDKDYQLTLVKCWLDTGRTHQIRVHFSHIGHPLAGDTLYGGKPIFNRQALHAVKLEFLHPFTGETITCLAPFLDNPPIFKEMDIQKI